jgi:L-fuculose-phosphate aldolase
MDAIAQQREAVAATCRRLASQGLVRGTSGNVSARAGSQIAISPTGAILAELRADQVTVVDEAGQVLDGDLAPSSEIGLHLGIYEAYEAGAVIHTHAPFATAIACSLDELPCVHYEMLALGGTVRVAPYEIFGSPELAEAAVRALDGRNAALLANHGTVCFGGDLDGAERSTELLEWASTLYYRAASLGTPRVLDEAGRQAVIDAAIARSYGSLQAAAGENTEEEMRDE